MTTKKQTKIKHSDDKVSKYHSSLLNLGLSSNEAKIYLYLLGRGESVGGTKIANGTGIHRQYVYIVIPKLIDQGLIEEVIAGKRAKYIALNPNKLTKIARSKVYEAEAVAEELGLLSKVGHQQESEVLFGVRELIEHEYEFEMGADFGETQYVIGGNAEAFIETVGDAYGEVLALDEKKKIITYYIGSKKDNKEKHLSVGREKRFHMRYISKMPEGITHTIIRKDRVCFFSFLNPPTVHIIKSKVVAQNYKDFFMMLWEMAEK